MSEQEKSKDDGRPTLSTRQPVPAFLEDLPLEGMPQTASEKAAERGESSPKRQKTTIVPGSGQSSTANPSQLYDADQTILKEIDEITTHFEKGKVSKPDAISKIIALAYRLHTTDTARRDAIVDFIGTLDGIETRAVRLRDRGKHSEAIQVHGGGDNTESAPKDGEFDVTRH
ncbi:hypothetical protein H0H93_010782, partial [Arthromyces matolae]